MNNRDVLDDELSTPEVNDFWGAIKWWEKKRLFYNGIIILTVVLTSLTITKTDPDYPLLFVVAIILLLIANTFYTLGWAFELLIRYYIKNHNFPYSVRFVFLILGLLLTVYVFGWSTVDLLIHNPEEW